MMLDWGYIEGQATPQPTQKNLCTTQKALCVEDPILREPVSTGALPGTLEKVEVFRRRYAAGERLHSAGDARGCGRKLVCHTYNAVRVSGRRLYSWDATLEVFHASKSVES